MARIHTHYDNLKVARNAPPEVIRAAYKTLSQKYHPDRNPDNTEAIRIIQIINSAYEVLSDPVKRQEHDDWIARSEAREPKRQQRSAGNPSVNGKPAYRPSRRQVAPLPKFAATFLQVAHRVRMMVAEFSRTLFKKV